MKGSARGNRRRHAEEHLLRRFNGDGKSTPSHLIPSVRPSTPTTEYAAIANETKLILDVALFGRHGTDSAAAFLHRLRESRLVLFDRVRDTMEELFNS